MTTIEDLLEQMKEAVADELGCTNLSDWSLAASGSNFKDLFSSLSARDLRDLLEEIQEGLELKITVDLTESILAQVEQLLEDVAEEDEEDSEEDSESLDSEED